jgi:hypothetical protein
MKKFLTLLFVLIVLGAMSGSASAARGTIWPDCYVSRI